MTFGFMSQILTNLTLIKVSNHNKKKIFEKSDKEQKNLKNG